MNTLILIVRIILLLVLLVVGVELGMGVLGYTRVRRRRGRRRGLFPSSGRPQDGVVNEPSEEKTMDNICDYEIVGGYGNTCSRKSIPGKTKCAIHHAWTCNVCGKPAVKGCNNANSLVCGVPVCEDHVMCVAHRSKDAD
jgi:hypothetical protein